MADDEDIAALVIDNGSGMCKGTSEMAEDRIGCALNGGRRGADEVTTTVIPPQAEWSEVEQALPRPWHLHSPHGMWQG